MFCSFTYRHRNRPTSRFHNNGRRTQYYRSWKR